MSAPLRESAWDRNKQALNLKPGELAHAFMVSGCVNEENVSAFVDACDRFHELIVVAETLGQQRMKRMSKEERDKYNAISFANIMYQTRAFNIALAEARRRFAERSSTAQTNVDLLEPEPAHKKVRLD